MNRVQRYPLACFVLLSLSTSVQGQEQVTSESIEGWRYSAYITQDVEFIQTRICIEDNGTQNGEVEVLNDGARLRFECDRSNGVRYIDYFFDWGAECQNGFTAIGYRSTPRPSIESCVQTGYIEGQPEVCCETGGTNPILISTRRKVQTEIDYQGQGDYPLKFSRTYTSGKPGRASNSLNSYLVKPWRHNYDKKLSGDLEGTGSNGVVATYRRLGYHYVPEPPTTGGLVGNDFNAQRPDGSIIRFTDFSAGNAQRVSLVPGTTPQGDQGFVLSTASDEQEFYNQSGLLVATRSRNGETHYLSYDSSNRLLSVVDDYGHSLIFEYDEDDNISAMIDPEGNRTAYTYNEYNDVSSVLYPDTGNGAAERIYMYEAAPRFLTGIVNERGDQYTSWTYATDSNFGGMATGSTGPDGINQVGISEWAWLNAVQVVNPLGLQTIYQFSIVNGGRVLSSKQRVATESTPAATESRSYDDNGFLTSITDWNGNTTTYTRDSRGLPLRQTLAVGTIDERVITREWHPDYRLPLSETHSDYRVDYERDSRGNVLARTITDLANNEVRRWAYTYDRFGKLLTIDGPRNDVSDNISLSYYDCSSGQQCGQLSQITDALGFVTQFTDYNAHGQLTRSVDANGTVSTYTYNARRWLSSQTVDSATTAIAYDAVGNITRVTLPDGTYTQYSWDVVNRLVGIKDGNGNSIVWTLDATGNRTEEAYSDPASSVRFAQGRAYDALSRLIETSYSHGGNDRYEYDLNGNSLRTWDSAEREETSTHDALDRLILLRDALDGDTRFVYDNQDNLLAVIDAEGETTTYTYNGFGDQLSQSSPDTGLTMYNVDAAGNRISQTDARNIQVEYRYDALNRITQSTYPDAAENIYYSYDQGANGTGRLTQISDASGSTDFGYDARGNTISMTYFIDGQSYTQSYTYNAADRLTGMTYPSGRSVSYSYDSSGRIDQVSSVGDEGSETLASSITRLPFGPTSALTLGNGVTQSRTYDKDYRVLTMADGSVFEKGYAYNAVNNITAITDVLDIAKSQLFSYDDLDRLEFAAGGYGDDDYTYDAIGNRLSTTRNNQSESYQYDSSNHQLQSRGGTSYSYDAVGNTLAGNGASFTYGDRNRMDSVTTNGVTTTYKHNAMGQRVFKNTAGAQTHYVYDLNGRVIAEADSSGAVQVEYSYLDGVPLAMWSEQSGAQKVSLASSGTASQSSTGYGGAASRAIDGNTSGVWQQGSVTHTNSENDPWWEVSLVERSAVSSVVLYNRTNCCASRLKDVHVFISEEPFGVQTLQELLARNDIAHEYLDGVQGAETEVSITGSGSYVRVQLAGSGILSLAEVEVFGVLNPAPLDTNLSLLGVASQSSTGYGGAANRAIDGNTSGVWRQGSVTHTNSESDPWWEVALAERSAISGVVLYNRTNCCASRLTNVHVFISEQPFGDQTLTELLARSDIAHEYLAGIQGAETEVPITGSGSFVRVQLAGNGILSLAEVEVFGLSNPAPLDVNLSPSGTANQSSTGFGGVANRAIDENTSGVWRQGSVTHTSSQSEPWWEVTLAEPSTINGAVLHNRTDCCAARLTNVHVFVSEQPFGTQTLAELLSRNDIAHEFLAGVQGTVTEVLIMGSGSYVRVQLAGTSALSLAEVEVLGYGNSALGGQ